MILEPGEHVDLFRVIGPYPGRAVRAVHVESQQRVVLDVDVLCGDWRERAVQLLRATTLLAGLDHPGIARIVARGVLGDRRPWFASELADGVVLSDILARRVLSVDETLALVRDLAAIVAHAHAHQLGHGAIHPHAIVMRTGERAFPIQLGAWSELRAFGTDLEAAVQLTPYAAPEAHYDGKADVYAIGVLAYRALTGRFPFAVELVAGVPGVVSALIVRMLAADPRARPDAESVYLEALDLTGDRVLSGPRFARPRWTPSPLADVPVLSGNTEIERSKS
jgi:serine/threonine protein kinase